ncbi:WD40 repeat-like protein [Exidia glandulosa HHB12029]|uniref:WD40 repeat-like protein n=1 Tax=Exidia glandulosa HHB12029 TaxID=1314781 RepID=A0A165K216_EXIGL|nr:WD40 repeat-like protein [Exidia glandulosa HHB12029]
MTTTSFTETSKDNILISDRGVPLLCDFGQSRIIAEFSESTTQTGPIGTWRWMAPELCLVEGARHSYESDIWACGCLFIEVWSSQWPYHSKTNQQQFILALGAREGPARPSNMPDCIWSRVEECCNFMPSQRPIASRVMQSLAVSGRSERDVPRKSIKLRESALSVAWFPDNERVAVGLHNNTALVLNVATGATCLHLVGHTNIVTQVAVSPDGRLVATCSRDKSIRLWDAETGLAVGTPMTRHTKWVRSVAFSPDARRIVSGSNDETIRVWSIETCATVLGPLRGHASGVTSVVYSSDGSRIASGSWDSTVRVWDAGSGAEILTLHGHSQSVRSVANSTDDLHIASGSDDCTIRIWDARTGRPVGRPLDGHSGWARSVTYSPDGARIVSASDDCTVRVWNPSAGVLLSTFKGHTDVVRSVAYSPDGRQLASCSIDGTVRSWTASAT